MPVSGQEIRRDYSPHNAGYHRWESRFGRAEFARTDHADAGRPLALNENLSASLTIEAIDSPKNVKSS